MLSPSFPTAQLLAVPPNERTDEQVHQLLSLKSLDAFANLPPAELLALARCWKYETHEAGSSICAINDENPCFMVVISGSLLLEETKLCHNLGETRPSSVASSEASSSGLSTRLLPVCAETAKHSGRSRRLASPIHPTAQAHVTPLAQLHHAPRLLAQLHYSHRSPRLLTPG